MKNKKIISIILSISLTVGSVISTTYVTRAANILHGTVLSKQGLNVRSESNTTSKIIGTLQLDDSVEVLETINGWYKIKFGSSYGYVAKQYIKLDAVTSTNNTNGTASTNTNTNTNTTTSNTSSSSNSSTTTDSTIKLPEYKNLDAKTDVDKLKQWKIKFNKKIKDTESNRNEFKVVDTKGNFVSTKILIDGSSVTILPWDTGYDYEGNYKLIIGDNIESDDGIKIKYTSTMPFTIKSKSASLGLGKTETEYVNNDKSYDWYINQDNTGKYSSINSGPAAVAMAIKWSTPSSDKSVADIRDAYENSGLAWNISTITSYLKSANINYSSCDDVSENSLKTQLKNGNILIVNLNPQYINYNNSSESKLGRFHVVDGNTYTVIIKGYKVVDNNTYFEIYDPFYNNIEYPDGSPRGKNDYYSANEVLNSLKAESVYPIVINK